MTGRRELPDAGAPPPCPCCRTDLLDVGRSSYGSWRCDTCRGTVFDPRTSDPKILISGREYADAVLCELRDGQWVPGRNAPHATKSAAAS